MGHPYHPLQGPGNSLKEGAVRMQKRKHEKCNAMLSSGRELAAAMVTDVRLSIPARWKKGLMRLPPLAEDLWATEGS